MGATQRLPTEIEDISETRFGNTAKDRMEINNSEVCFIYNSTCILFITYTCILCVLEIDESRQEFDLGVQPEPWGISYAWTARAAVN